MGHAFHDFLITTHQPLWWHLDYPAEVGELASVAMTYLALPALERDRGGCYAPQELAEVRRRLLHDAVVHWLPQIALVDAFQHWVFAAAPDEVQPAQLDAKWAELSARFQPWLDMTGLSAEMASGWQREGALFGRPFLYLGYAVATCGALQLWRQAQDDPAKTWQAYRAALALGNTATLQEIYATAGVRLPFDRQTVHDVAAFVAPHLNPTM
jgi:oligoendopeptidase F